MIAKSKYVLISVLIISFFSLASNFRVFESYVSQTNIITEFNSNSFNSITGEKVISNDLFYPNITITAIPFSGVKANYLMQEKQYFDALEVLNQSKKVNPFIYYNQSLKSKIFRTLQVKDSALYYGFQAYNGIPLNPVHFENIAIILASNDDGEELISQFLKVDHFDPQVYRILFASFLNLKDQSDERIKSIALNSLEHFSDNKEITNLALYVLYGLENVTESYNLSDKASELYSSNKFKEAIELYKKAIDLNPYDATFYENIGMCFYQLKQYEDVILFFEQSLEKKTSSLCKAEFFIGLSNVNLGKLEEGCLFLHKSKSLNYESAYNAIIKFCK